MSSTSTAAAAVPESTGGSPLTRKGQATRARIVKTAADLIFERGVAGTSIDDVRRRAKVSGSQMTHYFQDKNALVRAVIGHQLDAILNFHAQPELGQLDSFDALRLWADLCVEKTLDQNVQGGCSFGSLAGELAEADARMRADLAAGYDRWAEVLRSGLAAMRRRGELRPEAKPDVLTSVLLAAHQGGSLLSQTKRDIKPLRDALDAALNYIYSFAADETALPRTRRTTASPKSSSAPGHSTAHRQAGRGQRRTRNASKAS